MDIDELTKAKEKFSMKINKAIEEFEEEIGHSPCSISIDMIEITIAGDDRKKFAVERIHVFLDI